MVLVAYAPPQCCAAALLYHSIASRSDTRVPTPCSSERERDHANSMWCGVLPPRGCAAAVLSNNNMRAGLSRGGLSAVRRARPTDRVGLTLIAAIGLATCSTGLHKSTAYVYALPMLAAVGWVHCGTLTSADSSGAAPCCSLYTALQRSCALSLNGVHCFATCCAVLQCGAQRCNAARRGPAALQLRLLVAVAEVVLRLLVAAQRRALVVLERERVVLRYADAVPGRRYDAATCAAKAYHVATQQHLLQPSSNTLQRVGTRSDTV
jgi:hypothetical protein